MKTLLSTARLLAVFTLLLGVAYPALVWSVAHLAFADQASGSLVARSDGTLVGSALLAQKNEDPRYIWARPSAAVYATVASGASNLAWTSRKLRERIEQVSATGVPAVLTTTSGSGLDPHLPPEAARAQLDRVAAARGWNNEARARAGAWIADHEEGGIIAPRYINVLLLNLALDEIDRTSTAMR